VDPLLAAALIGLGVGFLGGLFGKGGSAVATPLLALAGVPAIAAVASPLPATIPSTLAASRAYARQHLADLTVVRWSVAFGVPATIAGSIATRWIGGSALVAATDAVLIGIGLRFALPHRKRATHRGDTPRRHPALLAAVAVTVGVASGLLANSGGFLLAPLYVTVLRMPIKRAFATSLLVASVLAVPGSLTHIALGHMDWAVVGVMAVTSVPLAFVGARVALRTEPERLERLYGAGLAVLGMVFLATR
jgi:uncharacterized membrane protein YfcA